MHSSLSWGVHKKTERGSYPLDRYQVASLLGVEIDPYSDALISKGGNAVIELPSEEELQDKSKSDWLAKLLVLVQTLWFIIQCVSRRMEHLPITGLEAVTLAYAVLNFAIYIAWWGKPSRVAYPIFTTVDVKPERKKEDNLYISQILHYIMGFQDMDVQLNDQKEAPNFYSGNPQDSHFAVASLLSFLLGIAFGAIHCIDWYFIFSSPTEQKLWRISSLLLAGVPFAGLVFLFLGLFTDGDSGNVWDTFIQSVIGFPLLLTSPLLLLGYLAGRIATIFVAFHSLHFLSPEAFIAVQWTNFIPHV